MTKVTRWGKYGNPYDKQAFREPDKEPGIEFAYWGAWTTEKEALREKAGLEKKGGRKVRIQYRPGPKGFVYVVFASRPKTLSCPHCGGFAQYFQGKRVCRDCGATIPLNEAEKKLTRIRIRRS